MNPYEWRSLTNAVNKVKVLDPFLMGMFFSTKQAHNTENIDVEIVESGASVAQFVSPNGSPKRVKKRVVRTESFKIPRTYEFKEFNASDLARFKETITGGIFVGSDEDIKNQARQNVQAELIDLKNRAMNRRELMAAEAIVSGRVTVDVDGTTNTLEFGYANNVNLFNYSGTSRWGESGADIFGDIIKYPRMIYQRTKDPQSPIIALLGAEAADAFRKDERIENALYKGVLSGSNIDKAYNPETASSNFIGKIGNTWFYEYGQSYTNSAGQDVEVFAPGRVVFGQKNLYTKLHTGPIFRISKENNQPLQIFNEFYMDAQVDRNYTQLEWSLEQKSVPIIGDIDKFISIAVR